MAGKPGRCKFCGGRCCTAWMDCLATAAVDSRVSAIILVAADILNLNVQMKHHANVILISVEHI